MNIFENKPLSSITYYHIGGVARYILEVPNRESLTEALSFIKEHNITNVRVVGLGANIISPDEDFDGAVIWLHGDGSSIQQTGETVSVFAGESIASVIDYTLGRGLIGLEWAGGLPSTIGGALRGNAGAFGSEIKDSVIQVEVLDLSHPEKPSTHFTNAESAFSYRNSYFKQHPHLLIVNVTFQLKKGTEDDIQLAKEICEQNKVYRQRNHPMEYPSCGSVFKNIVERDQIEKIFSVWPDVRKLSEEKWHNKVSMGYLLKRLGFSGKRIGGAQVSEKHTNYISNIDNAKASDVIALIQMIQKTFQEMFGFVPEPEVVIV